MTSFTIVIINSVLYVTLLAISIIKKKGILGIIMTSFYALLAVGCAVYYKRGEYWSLDLLLWPFLYYFLIYIILLQPFQKRIDILNKISIPNIRLMNVVFDLYLVISVLYIITFLGNVLHALRSGNWMSIYVAMRSDDAVFYHNLYERILINVSSYLQIPAVFYAFYSFAQNINYKRKAILLVMPLITSFMWAIITASRSSFLGIGVLYLICYLICSENLSSIFKKRLLIVFSVAAALAASFILAVNVSRFGEGDNSWTSSYFGHSYIVGHNTIAFTTRLGYGSGFFGFLYGLLHVNVPAYQCLIDDGVSFHPMIGMRYSDFGLLGTFVYALLVCWLFKSIIKKKTITIGEVYCVFYFYKSLLTGALYDNTNVLAWLIVIVVSVLLTYLSKINTTT